MLHARYAGCVYIATNRVNGRAYIGKTIAPLSRRRAQHKRRAVCGGSSPFYSAISKYGWDAFAWRELFTSNCEATLFDAERSLILDFKANGVRLYNVSGGGEGQSVPCSPDRRQKVATAMAGRTLSEEHCRKLRERQTGTSLSHEIKEKIRRAKLGKKGTAWTQERRDKRAATWAAKIAAGYTRSAETKQRCSAAAKARYQREGERDKARAAGKLGAAARWGS